MNYILPTIVCVLFYRWMTKYFVGKLYLVALEPNDLYQSIK